MNEINFKHLYFAEELDISAVTTTVGSTITVGEATLKYAHTTSDFGGAPETIDCTPLSALVRMSKSGIKANEQFTITFYQNDADFALLKGYEKSKQTVAMTVTAPNGQKVTNNVICTDVHWLGLAVNSMLEAQATFETSNADGWGYNAGTGTSG